MKLIIDIPKESYEYIKTMSDQGWLTSPEYANAIRLTSSDYAYVIKNGTPLDDVKAEINKAYIDVTMYSCDEQVSYFASRVSDILNNIDKADSEDKE